MERRWTTARRPATKLGSSRRTGSSAQDRGAAITKQSRKKKLRKGSEFESAAYHTPRLAVHYMR